MAVDVAAVAAAVAVAADVQAAADAIVQATQSETDAAKIVAIAAQALGSIGGLFLKV